MISHYKQFRTDTLRLRHQDYSQPGYYFITLCINNRERLFGLINHGIMVLNEYGNILEQCWLDLPIHYQNMKLDTHVVMPNHFHGIIKIVNESDKRYSLSEFVRALKTFSARRINELRHTVGKNVWQYGYYDHVIRDVLSLQQIREYILKNPEKWEDDRFFQL